MRAVVSPGKVGGTWFAPPSKSHFQRACAGALLHRGTTRIWYPGTSADDRAALRIIEDLGAAVVGTDDRSLTVRSYGVHPRSGTVSCGESGLAARLFTPIAALAPMPVHLTGEGSLRRRPMGLFADVLPRLGVRLDAAAPTLPYTVTGPLRARSLQVDGSLSSQFISGLLFALSEAATEPVTLTVRNPVSLPYLEMTLRVLRAFGRPVSEAGPCLFRIDPVPDDGPAEVQILVEGDWSAAAAALAAAATTGSKLRLEYLERDTAQADAALWLLLYKMGALIDWDGPVLRIQTWRLNPFHIDATHCPDLVPVLAVIAAACTGTCHIDGMHRLTHKESNRAETTAYVLRQAGIPHLLGDDTLIIYGPAVPKSCTIDGHNDHRIVMAAAVLALRADGPITIEGIEAVGKSYPEFFQALQRIGARVAFPG